MSEYLIQNLTIVTHLPLCCVHFGSFDVLPVSKLHSIASLPLPFFQHNNKPLVIMPRRGRGKQGKQSTYKTELPPPPPQEEGDRQDNQNTPPTTTIPDQASAVIRGTKSSSSIHDETASEFSDLILTSEKRRGVYECDYCHSDISQLPRVRCAQCPDFDLCLDCFATSDHAAVIARLKATTTIEGAAVLNHDVSHGYRVCESTRYPLFPTSRKFTSTSSRATSVVEEASSVKDEINSKKQEDDDEDYDAEAMSDAPAAAYSEKPAVETKEETSSSAPIATPVATTEEGEGGSDKKSSQHESSVTPEELQQQQQQTKSSTEIDKPKAQEAPSTEKPGTATSEEPKALTEVSSTKASQEDAEDGNTSDVIVIHSSEDSRNVWTIEEDLRLLEGIQTHGLANWVEISEAVSGQGSAGKTPKRCMERYLDDFLGRYGHILPLYTLTAEDNDDDEENADERDATVGTNNNDTASNTPSKTDDGGGTEEGSAVRASKRRAVLMRSPSTFSNASGMMGPRKKFKCVPTESVPDYQDIWPDPYLPNAEVQMGQEVGRDQMYKAEQAYVRTVTPLDSKEKVDQVRKEWEESKLNKPGGPAVLPMRVEDIMTMPGAELHGFMPRRGDFDIEWENDAEQAVADMEFLPGESEEDKQLKLQVLAIYNSKLDEREKRKKFILSRKLYDYRRRQAEDQLLPRDERDLVQRMRLFERFHTPQEHEQFLADILKAKRLRKEIAKLQTYRRIGIRTLADAEKYELDKARHQFHKTAHLQKEAEMKRAEDNTGDQSKKVFEDTDSMSLWKQYRPSDRKSRRSVNRGKVGEASSVSKDETDLKNESDRKLENTKDTEVMEAQKTDNTESDAMDVDQADDQTDASGEEKKQDLAQGEGSDDLSKQPAYNLLSEREVALCRKSRLLPVQYIEIKKTLVQQSLAAGLLEKDNSQQVLVKIDAKRRGDVIDFLVRAGWVSTTVGEAARSWK